MLPFRSLGPAPRALFVVFASAMAFSVAGSLALRLFPVLAGWIGPWYVTLVKAPTWTYMAVMPVLAFLLYLPAEGRSRMLRLLVLGSLIGGMSELVGTTTGFPFGQYLYTAWLGPKILDHVPWFIPPSWFAMSVVSYDLAGRLAGNRWARIALTAVLMMAWDVSLDPAMSKAFPFWTYPEGGFFYGMPLSNWGGWLFVSALIATAYEFVGGGPLTPNAAAPAYYVLNCAFPIAISLVFGLEGAAVIGAAVTAAVWYAVQRRGAHAIA